MNPKTFTQSMPFHFTLSMVPFQLQEQMELLVSGIKIQDKELKLYIRQMEQLLVLLIIVLVISLLMLLVMIGQR